MADRTGPLALPPVELRELQIFLAVAEELHFGRAAERLQCNRSRVSQVVKGLEARLGGRLFDRTSRRVRLTPIGEQLLDEATRPYRELHDVLGRVRQAATGIAGALRLGLYSPLSAGCHMTEIVRTFKARHPSCDVKFVNTGYDRSYVDVLRNGDVDMLAVRIPLSTPDVTVGPILSREERVVIVANDDPLAAHESISYEELADRAVSDVPAFPREMMDAFIPPTTPSGRPLRRIANQGYEDALMRVALGVQVHPTVRSFLDHHAHPGVTSVPIRDLPPSETALVWLKDDHSLKIEAFVRAAADVLGGPDRDKLAVPTCPDQTLSEATRCG